MDEPESFKELIEKIFKEHIKKNEEDWTDELIPGPIGECECCGKRENLTRHHLIPKRLLNSLNPLVARQFEKHKLEVCLQCHGTLHPENLWKKQSIDMERIFKKQAMELENRTKADIEKIKEQNSQLKQSNNNILSKNNSLTKDISSKDDIIKKLKERNNTISNESNCIRTELETTKKDNKEIDSNLMILWNLLLSSEDSDYFEKYKKEFITPRLNSFKHEIESIGPIPKREINNKLKKMLMFGELFCDLFDFDEEDYSTKRDALLTKISEIYQEELKTCLDD